MVNHAKIMSVQTIPKDQKNIYKLDPFLIEKKIGAFAGLIPGH